jgi:hypothetical protein
MARMRTVKPGLRTSRVVAKWPFEVRYFWVLLWGYLDDEGRGLDIPKAIAGDCFPHDDRITATVINRWMDLMARTKVDPDREPPLCRYEVAGTRYTHSVYWEEHQKPNRPSPSRIPHCPVHEGLTESLNEPPPEPVTEPPLSPHTQDLEGLRVRGFEGLSAAAEPVTEPPTPPPPNEPPPKCPKHIDDPDPPPCGPCGTARRRHEAWQAEQIALDRDRRMVEAIDRSEQARADAQATRAAIDACRLCNQRGYLPGGHLCTHDPIADQRAHRGAAAVRAALTKGAP